MEHATTDSLRLMQSDSYKKLAEWALPSRLQALDSASLDASGKEVRQMLADWNYQNSAELIAPSVFEVWWDFLKQAIWDDEFPEHETRPMRHPADDRTVRLLKMEKDAPWYDNVNTPAQETLNQVVAASFSRALDSLRQTYGPSGKKWQWGQVKGTHVPHLLGQDALGSPVLFMGGGKDRKS